MKKGEVNMKKENSRGAQAAPFGSAILLVVGLVGELVYAAISLLA